MSDEPTTTDWGYPLHRTEGPPPYGPEWFMLKPGRHHEGSGGKYRNILNGCYIEMYLTDERWEDDEEQEALANQALICAAPMFREEVIRLRASIERAISTLRSQPNDLEDGPDYHRDLLSFLDGAICHAVDILEGKE